MDYGRLFLFMAAATAVMAIGTHLWCWAYKVVSRVMLYWRIDRLRKQLEIDSLEDEEIERRRAAAPRYQTWEQAMGDFGGGVPLDDILDRLNGEFPPRAVDVKKTDPLFPILSNPAVIAIGGLALLAFLFGGKNMRAVEELLKVAKSQVGEPPKPGGA